MVAVRDETWDLTYLSVSAAACVVALAGAVLVDLGSVSHLLVSWIFSVCLVLSAAFAMDSRRPIGPFFAISLTWMVEASLEMLGLLPLGDFDMNAVVDSGVQLLVLVAAVVAIRFVRARNEGPSRNRAVCDEW